jgi:hypothetical protein
VLIKVVVIRKQKGGKLKPLYEQAISIDDLSLRDDIIYPLDRLLFTFWS